MHYQYHRHLIDRKQETKFFFLYLLERKVLLLNIVVVGIVENEHQDQSQISGYSSLLLTVYGANSQSVFLRIKDGAVLACTSLIVSVVGSTINMIRSVIFVSTNHRIFSFI